MYWAPFFHIYQPPDQNSEILERIVNESYRPLLKGWLANPKAKVTLNINACLTEMLAENNYQDIISGFSELAERGQLEFSASAKFHPFLPILPKNEMIRQIKLNEETNSKYFGPVYKPKGFFPPEMGYSRDVGEVVRDLGYQWIILDEISYNGRIEQVKYDRLYYLSGAAENKLHIFFRERRTSNLIMSAMTRTRESLWQAVSEENSKDRYLITAMDGETFGHHRPGLDLTLFELYEDPNYDFVTTSELLTKFGQNSEPIDPVSSCWASSEEEISKGKNFYLYYNKDNKLHVLQKQLIDLVINLRVKSDKSDTIDTVLSCNHMWWANPDAWWSIEEIEKGAYMLKRVTEGRSEEAEAESLYRQILNLAFKWQREGLVQKLHEQKETYKKIPFQKRAREGEYQAILAILKEEEQKAVRNREYELAIRWRDSIYKLEKDLDIYDFVHIVDQMRAEGKLGKYQSLAKKYKDQYNKLAPGQPDK